MAEKTLSFNLTMDDGDTKARLDELADKLSAMTDKFHDISMRLDGVDEAKIDLDDVQVKLDRLAKVTAKPNITIEGYHRAILDIDKLDARLDMLSEKKATPKIDERVNRRGGWLQRLFNLNNVNGGEEGEGEGFLGKALSLLNPSAESFGGTGGSIASIGVLAALTQALTTTAVAAAGLGIALAPIATELEGEVTPAWDKWEKKIDALPESKKTVSDFGSAFTQLLNDMTPVVVSMMPMLDRVIRDIGQSLKSGGLKTFFDWLAINAPKAFDAVARGVDIATHAVHDMMPVIDIVVGVFKAFFHLLDAGFDLLGAVIDLFTGNWQAAGNRLMAVFHNLWDVVKDILGAIYNAFKAEMGYIVNLLIDLAPKMLTLGEHMMEGLLHGLEDIGADVVHYVEHLATSILDKFTSFFHFGSPSRVTYQHGLWIGEGLALGMEASVGRVSAAASKLGQAAMGGVGHASAVGAGSGGPVQLEIHLKTDSKGLLADVSKAIRVNGGDPRVLLRKTVVG